MNPYLMCMKRILLFAAIALSLSNLSAQTYYKSTKDGKPVTKTSRWNDYARSQYFGVRVGVSVAWGWMYHGQMNDINTNSQTGVSVALLYGKQIATPDVPLFIEAGLRYVQKGFVSDFDWKGKHYDYKHNMNYLQIPLHFKYKIRTGVDDLTVQPFVGGFFEIGLGSTSLKYEPTREKFDTFSDEILKRVDAGVRFGLGAAYQNFYLELTYDLGLVNTLRDGTKKYYPMYEGFDESAHHGCFCASIGLDF